MHSPHQNIDRCRDGESISKVCGLKPANIDRIVTMSQNTPPCSWTFPTSWVLHAATSGFRDTVHHPYISSCFFFCWKCFHCSCFFSASFNKTMYMLEYIEYTARNTFLNMTVSMTSHVLERETHPTRSTDLNSDMFIHQKCTHEMGVMTTVNCANLGSKQNRPFRVHYAADNSTKLCQKNP